MGEGINGSDGSRLIGKQSRFGKFFFEREREGGGETKTLLCCVGLQRDGKVK